MTSSTIRSAAPGAWCLASNSPMSCLRVSARIASQRSASPALRACSAICCDSVSTGCETPPSDFFFLGFRGTVSSCSRISFTLVYLHRNFTAWAAGGSLAAPGPVVADPASAAARRDRPAPPADSPAALACRAAVPEDMPLSARRRALLEASLLLINQATRRPSNMARFYPHCPQNRERQPVFA